MKQYAFIDYVQMESGLRDRGLTPEADVVRAYAATLRQQAEAKAGVTDECVLSLDAYLWREHGVCLGKTALRAALLAVWPVAAEPAQPVERRWTGPGYLEQTGYIDPQPGEHVSDAESLLRSAAQKAVRANFDLRVRNNEIVGLLSEVLGFIGNVTDDERDIANRITKCLGATFVTEPLRPGYVRCQKCEAQMGGYGYGKFPKLCPVCQDISTKPAKPAQPADSERVEDEMVQAALCAWFEDDAGIGITDGEPATEGWKMRMRAALQAALAQSTQGEAVAEVGMYWELHYVGNDPISKIVDRTGLKIGDKLYIHAERARVPEGWALVPEKFGIPADAWEAAAFAFGGPGTGEEEPYLNCTAWIGDIENDDGSKTHGLHIQCDECPEEGSITIAEFAAAPSRPAEGE